jgi:protein involved in polysaccharide export with SLBB domain
MKSKLRQIMGRAALAITSLAGALLVGCHSTSSLPAQPIMQQPGVLSGPMGPAIYTNTNTASALLRIGDLVVIDWSDTPKEMLPFKDRIRDDGTLVLPFNVQVKAAGLTVSQLQDSIHQAYVPRIYRHLTASVKTEERVYFVGGEVRTPNRFLYVSELTVLRAIDTAGGFTDFANKKNIELRRANGQNHRLNWHEAMKDSRRDLPVYPNDQIIVHKRWL